MRRSIIRFIKPTLLAAVAVLACALGADARIWQTSPTPIQAYAQVFYNGSWYPSACPRPAKPEITIAAGDTLSFRVAGWEDNCTELLDGPVDWDQYSDPTPATDIVFCNWDFEDGTTYTGYRDPNDDTVEKRGYTISHTFNQTGVHYVLMRAWDNAQAHNEQSGGQRLPGADDPDVVQVFKICVGNCDSRDVPRIGRGLPTSNINGADRCNFRWADTQSDIFYGDDFVMPAGLAWAITKMSVWLVPPVPENYPYSLGDIYQTISLYYGVESSSLSLRTTGTLSAGSNAISSSNGTITITAAPSCYTLPGTGQQEGYKTASGVYNRLWRIDFTFMPSFYLGAYGGLKYIFGVRAVPRGDRQGFIHGVSLASSGLTDASADGKIRRINASNLAAGSTLVDTGSWFGKGADISVEMFAQPWL